jgi:hypothetical protein
VDDSARAWVEPVVTGRERILSGSERRLRALVVAAHQALDDACDAERIAGRFDTLADLRHNSATPSAAHEHDQRAGLRREHAHAAVDALVLVAPPRPWAR